ncbi:hypothetical protein N7478_010164 [Penicillium angulare]|uniref:uncharacterized protein n=1 Tax=Penicillium angulare TaxID=116970 RepID=UPI00253FE9C3|nr:uncharacterized protein N7478_010164 [Penicillium angulare]KAJ5267356.1 hypothetical protein N7478_010164 [Penicillium angulare]
MSDIASDRASELGCDFSDPSSQLIRELHESQVGVIRKGIKAWQKITLHRSPSYLSDWDGKSAFRELYQNWKDAIMETHRLHRKEFRPILRDEGHRIMILVPRPSPDEQSSEALGFIKYQKSNGSITLVNSNSSLPIEALGIGWSSKKGPDSIGRHGEGLKLAAMVLIREGYQVRMAASRTNWTFSWDQTASQVSCSLRPSLQKEAPDGADAAIHMDRLRARIDRDVSVTIASSQDQLPAETFLNWLSVTMDIRGLNYPVTVATTDYGDLSYNFAHGMLTRDRLWVANQQSEANLVRKIWECALTQHGKELLPIYVSLLRHFPNSADVALADRLLEASTRHLIWQHLLRNSNNREFFYDGRLSSQTAEMIRKHTGKQSVALPPPLWEMLRSSTSIRTFEEEQTKRFKDAPLAEHPTTTFGQTVARAVRACMALLSATQNIEDNILKIRGLWLDFQSVHGGGSCCYELDAGMVGPDVAFFCDHTIEELMLRAVDSVFQSSPPLAATKRRYLGHIRRILRFMPQRIESSYQHYGLVFTWENHRIRSVQMDHDTAAQYHVVLHEEKRIAEHSYKLLHTKITDASEPSPCGCAQGLVSEPDMLCAFQRLDRAKPYFAMIALNEDSSC